MWLFPAHHSITYLWLYLAIFVLMQHIFLHAHGESEAVVSSSRVCHPSSVYFMLFCFFEKCFFFFFSHWKFYFLVKNPYWRIGGSPSPALTFRVFMLHIKVEIIFHIWLRCWFLLKETCELITTSSKPVLIIASHSKTIQQSENKVLSSCKLFSFVGKVLYE